MHDDGDGDGDALRHTGVKAADERSGAKRTEGVTEGGRATGGQPATKATNDCLQEHSTHVVREKADSGDMASSNPGRCF